VLLFTVYAPDMPKRLPIRDLVVGLLRGILRAVRYWLHYTLVALAWLGIVPLTACKYYYVTIRDVKLVLFLKFELWSLKFELNSNFICVVDLM